LFNVNRTKPSYNRAFTRSKAQEGIGGAGKRRSRLPAPPNPLLVKTLTIMQEDAIVQASIAKIQAHPAIISFEEKC
jgi:hypothetical protein